MSDRDALIAAILTNPDEDTPRLVFADWLQEHDQPERAEFIRVQCELARQREAEADLPDHFSTSRSTGGPWRMSWRPHDTEERLALLKRESELLIVHSDEWRQGLPKYADNAHNTQSVSFRRGFVGKVCVALGPFMKSPAELWKHHPVESLMLTNCHGAARLKLPKCRHLTAVRELRFIESIFTADMFTPIAECPYLSGVRTLDLASNLSPEAAIKELARSPHLKPTTLKICCGPTDGSGFAALLNGPFASRLRRLQASGTSIWGGHVIAGAPLAELRRLELRGGYFGDADVAALTQSKHLTRLVTLDLSHIGITNSVLRVLAEWSGLAIVRSLNLGDNKEITARGVVTLLKSPYLKPVHFGLRGTAIGDEGAKALAAWPGLADLVTLDLTCADIDEWGLTALAGSPHWRDMRYLTLSGNKSTNGPAARRLRERLGPGRTDIWS